MTATPGAVLDRTRRHHAQPCGSGVGDRRVRSADQPSYGRRIRYALIPMVVLICKCIDDFAIKGVVLAPTAATIAELLDQFYGVPSLGGFFGR